MRTIYWIGNICAIFLFSIAQAQVANDSRTTTSKATSVQHTNTASFPATCRSGTVNYITHTLPQQCMTSTRQSGGTTSEASRAGNETSASTQSAASSQTTGAQSTVTTAVITSSQTEHPPPSSGASQDNTSSETISTTSIATATTTETETESETDSPLDNANFLSFDEWKKQNLAKAGQSPDHVGQQRSSGEMKGRTRPGINNALDVLGEDSEIELDFSGFGSAARPDAAQYDDAHLADKESVKVEKVPSNGVLRSKDAGKTCKERTNYASFDCAATVLKSNPDCKSASSVLIENKDSYMLNTCSVSNKYFIVELCDDILIDTVVLANYEFFSSIFRTFRLSVSDRYPVKADRWKNLGVFEARNTRNVQAFLVEQPLIWARYLRIEFLSHYGNEYYCPVSLLRVHGTTMMDEYRQEEHIARGDYSEDVAEEERGLVAPSAVAQEQAEFSQQADSAAIESLEKVPRTTSVQPTVPPDAGGLTDVLASVSSDSDTGQSTSSNPAFYYIRHATPISPVESRSSNKQVSHSNSSAASTRISYTQHASDKGTITTSVPVPSQSVGNSNMTSTVESPSTSNKPSVGSPASKSQDSGQNASSSSSASVASSSASDSASDVWSSSTKSSSSVKSTAPVGNGQSTASVEAIKHATQSTHAPPAMPTTQESFFKSIHKRLQMLESNATLSLQYIEEQSRILRDAFTKVEKRQIGKTETFLNNLNATVMAELHGFRQQYDQLWQSTVIELETHREQHQREMLAVSARLSVVADELIFQKRMVIVQSTLLMLCLGFVLFARAGSSTLELPLLQQMVNKRASFYSPPTSPSPDGPSPPRPSSKGNFWRRRSGRGLSEGSIYDRPESHDGPELHFQPPTPTSQSAESEVDDEVRDTNTGSVDGDGDMEVTPQETQSGPSTPTGTRDSPALLHEGHEIWPRPRSPLSREETAL